MSLHDYIASVLSQRPASFWPGGEPSGAIKDVVLHPISDSTYDGSLAGSVTRRASNGLAVGGYAWDFAGGYIEIPDHAEYRQNFVTLEAWVNPDNWTGFNGVLSKVASNRPKPWDTYIADSSGKMTFILAGPSTADVPFVTSTTVPVGKWTHILCRTRPRTGGATGVVAEIYFNGKKQPLEGSDEIAHFPPGGTNTVRIGNRADGVTSMDGRIAFPAIYAYPIALGPVRRRVAMGRGLLGGSPARALALR